MQLKINNDQQQKEIDLNNELIAEYGEMKYN